MGVFLLMVWKTFVNLTPGPLINNTKQIFNKGDKYIVVHPQTKFALGDISHYIKRKEYIKERLKIEGYDITNILDEWINKNKKSVPLNIQIKLPKGYTIDYENKFNKYFEKEGGYWKKLHEENPNVFGLTNVSTITGRTW